MKQLMALLLLTAAVASGSIQVYSVEPVDMAHSAFVTRATEDLIAVADTLLASDVFLGSPDTGVWQVTIRDENGAQQGYPAQRQCNDSLLYKFVHFTFSPKIAVQKGSKYSLEISHSSGQAVTQVFWNPNGIYAFGHVTLEGNSFHPPPQTPNCNLAARVFGCNSTFDPGFCGGVGFWASLDDARRALDSAQNIGVNWMRSPFNWCNIEPQQGTFVWDLSGCDSLVSLATSRHVHVLTNSGDIVRVY